MDMLPMLISFIIACVVINVCLAKRQMKIARAIFLAFGIVIGIISISLIYADWQFSQVWCMQEISTELNFYTKLLLGISTLVFYVVILVIAIATIILSVLAIKKIAEYIKSKKRRFQRTPGENQKPIAEPVFACARKIFVLHCRWNN